MLQPALEAKNLSKKYTINDWGSFSWWPGQATSASSDNTTLWALRDVSFKIQAGEVVGILGRNGAGKSTLLKIISRVTEPTEGALKIRGRVASLLEVGIGFHPELSGRENMFLSGALYGISNSEMRRRLDEIIDYSGIEKFVDTPVKKYSSGMYARLAFAVAVHTNPNILLVDEVLSVGDLPFQAKCLGTMKALAKQGVAMIFVSHNLMAIKDYCSRGMLLTRGRLTYVGDVSEAIEAYQKELFSFDKKIDSSQQFVVFELLLINGQPCEKIPRLPSRQPIELRLQFSNRIVLNQSIINLVIETIDGTVLIHVRSDQTLPPIQFQPGRHEFKFSFPSWPLAPGQYRLWFRMIGVDPQAAFGSDSDKLPFSIAGDGELLGLVSVSCEMAATSL